jgi:hypothetical protein
LETSSLILASTDVATVPTYFQNAYTKDLHEKKGAKQRNSKEIHMNPKMSITTHHLKTTIVQK